MLYTLTVRNTQLYASGGKGMGQIQYINLNASWQHLRRCLGTNPLVAAQEALSKSASAIM